MTTLNNYLEITNLRRMKHYLGAEINLETNGIFELYQLNYIDEVALNFGLENSKDVYQCTEIIIHHHSSLVN